VPQADPAHPAPLMLQVTPLFDESFITLAVKFRDWPWSTVCAVDGDRVTESGGTVIESEADLVLSATDVAVMVTERLAATVLGAVYVVAAPLAVAAGDTVPQGAVEHDTVQVTPLFDESLATVALIFRDWPCSTVCAVDGETDTERAMTATEPGADLVLSATEVAVTVTDRLADTEPGAV
jgi:hypothetical protein